MNIVPRTGGNTFTGHFFATGFNDATQSEQLHGADPNDRARPGQPLNARASELSQLQLRHELLERRPDHQGSAVVFRRWCTTGAMAMTSPCSTTGTPATSPSGLYEADPARQAKSDGRGPIQPNLRLTFQVTPRNKLNLFWDEQISNDSIGQGNVDERAGDRRLESRLAARAAGQVDVDGRPTSCCSRPGSAPTCPTGTRVSGRTTTGA